jgi:hypothetical protein
MGAKVAVDMSKRLCCKEAAYTFLCNCENYGADAGDMSRIPLAMIGFPLTVRDSLEADIDAKKKELQELGK